MDMLHQAKRTWALDAELSLAPPTLLSTLNQNSRLHPFGEVATCSGSQMLLDGDRKRKRGDWSRTQQSEHGSREVHEVVTNSIELQPQAPLPPGWEQCLDLQSGEMYYVNWNTNTRTSQDPRQWHSCDDHMSHKENLPLHLQLGKALLKRGVSSMQPVCLDLGLNPPCTDAGNRQQGRWQPGEADMVAVACRQCLMFVMLSQASPFCPNCGSRYTLDVQPEMNINRPTLGLFGPSADFGSTFPPSLGQL